MNKPITVKELLKLCQEEIKKGHGDYSIMISDDDEGNGYHYLWFEFSNAKDILTTDYDTDLLDESIAPIDKTLILG